MTLPAEMTAIVISKPGGPEVLTPSRMPVPKPGAGQLLIKVAAAGVNRPDVLQRQGSYAPPPGASPLPGLEAAGTVVATGEGNKRFKAGDQLTALLNGGGYAEYALVEEGAALPIPKGLDLVTAAAIPETFFTVWHNVFERGELSDADWLLVHGGTSGIGTTAIMLASAFGAKVIATAGGPEKAKFCESLGATLGVDYHAQDFVQAVKAATGGAGVNVILDMVGGDYLMRNIQATAPEARIVQIAFLRGSKTEIDIAPLMMKRLVLTGSTLRPRTTEFKARLAREVETNVWPLIEAGKVKPVIHATFPLNEAAAAHRLMETNSHIGKIVLTA